MPRKVSKKKTTSKKTTAKKKTAKKAVKKVVKENKLTLKEQKELKEKEIFSSIGKPTTRILLKLFEENKKDGYIKDYKLEEYFPRLESSDSRWKRIKEFLVLNKIDIIKSKTLFGINKETDLYFPEEETKSYDSVQMYLRDIGKYKLLSSKEEKEYAEKIAARNRLLLLYAKRVGMGSLINDGKLKNEKIKKKVWNAYLKKKVRKIPDDEKSVMLAGAESRNKLATANLRLVVSIAKNYSTRSRDLSLLDLVQEGANGLYKAVDDFDHEKGYKFSTYATWWIKQAITRALANNSRTIRVPVHMSETISRYQKTLVQLENDLGRKPTIQEVKVEMDTDEDKINIIRGISRDVIQIDRPIGFSGEDKDTKVGDIIADQEQLSPEDQASKAFLQEQMKEVLDSLTPKEREIIKLRHGMEDGVQYTLEQIGKKFNVTRERVRQIESNVLDKLKKNERVQKMRNV